MPRRAAPEPTAAAPASPPPAADGAPTAADAAPRWRQRQLAGGSLARVPAVFSPDGNFVFACAGPAVRLVSVQTGETVRVLPHNGGAVVSAIINPINPLQLLTATAGGDLSIWDYNDSVHLKCRKLKARIVSMVASDPDQVFVASVVAGDKQKIAVHAVDPLTLSTTLLYHTTAPGHLTVGNSGKFLVSCADNSFSVFSVWKKALRKITHVHAISTVAVHPTRPMIATADSNGAIHIWYDVKVGDGHETQQPVRTTLLWHSRPASALSFSHDGRYLVSGGREAVLVIWQLESSVKTFLPRLGSAIAFVTISPDGSTYLVGCKDNCLRVVNVMANALVRSIRGLSVAGADDDPSKFLTGLVVDPRTGLVVLNGTPGSLQFFDVERDRHVLEFDVVPKSSITSAGDGKVYYTYVENVVFVADGSSMVTFDKRTTFEDATPELSLKFWQHTPGKNGYVLNTVIDAPHRGSVTAKLVAHPHLPMIVSWGKDKKFKIWIRKERESVPTVSGSNKTPPAPAYQWACRSAGFFRSSRPVDAAFSPDGSLLAVSFGQIITLWDPMTNSLMQTLTHPPPVQRIERLCFISKAPFLVCCSRSTVFVWNLLTCSIWWSCRLFASTLAADPASNRFAVVVSDSPKTSCLVLFEPDSPVPVLALKQPHHTIADAIFLQGSVVYLTSNHQFHILSDDDGEQGARSEQADTLATPAAPAGLLQAFGKSVLTSPNMKPVKAASQHASTGRTHAGLDMFSAPSHILPPASRLFDSFMDSMLKKKAPPAEPAPAQDPAEIPELSIDDPMDDSADYITTAKAEREPTSMSDHTGSSLDETMDALDLDLDDSAARSNHVDEGLPDLDVNLDEDKLREWIDFFADSLGGGE